MALGPSQDCLDQLASFPQLLSVLQSAFRILEKRVPRPGLARVYGRYYFRHNEKLPEQAALQKLARYISGLNALVLLLQHRMLQEEGVIKRTLDELGDDIMFLLMKPENEHDVALHKRFLDTFFQEEFDEGVAPIDSTRRRDQIPRRKIRAYIDRQSGGLGKGKQAMGLVYQAYSGYVHAASPHLMEMCSFQNQEFDLAGVNDLDLFESHTRDAVNYFVRGFYAVAALASVFGEQDMYKQLRPQGDALDSKWS